MKIIIYHKQEHIREQLFADLKEKMLNARKKIKTKSWQDIMHGCLRSLTDSCFKKVPPFVNKYDIDDFIDEWWMYNCPDSYTTSDINRQVYNLIHQLFLIDEEEIKLENEAQTNALEEQYAEKLLALKLAKKKTEEAKIHSEQEQSKLLKNKSILSSNNYVKTQISE